MGNSQKKPIDYKITQNNFPESPRAKLTSQISTNLGTIAYVRDYSFSKSSFAHAAMIGAVIGDAVGSYCESDNDITFDVFTNLSSNGDITSLNTDVNITSSDIENALSLNGGGIYKLHPGQYTSNAELPLVLMHSILNNKSFDVESVSKWYMVWSNTMNPFNCGVDTNHALSLDPSLHYDLYNRIHQKDTNFKRLCNPHSNSKSNECLIRCIPLAIYGFRIITKDPNYLANLVISEAKLTHSSWVPIYANVFYVLTLAHLINSGITGSVIHTLRVERAINCAIQWFNNKKKSCKNINQLNALNNILEMIQKAKQPGPIVANIYPKWVSHAFVLAFRNLLLEKSYIDAIKETLAEGGNTGANVMIVCGLLGALHGMGGNKGIPQEMWDKVFQADTSNSHHSRPRWLQGHYIPLLVNEVIRFAPVISS